MSQSAVGIGNIQQTNSVTASSRVSAVRQEDMTRQRITSIKTQTLYVIQSASRDYARNTRIARVGGGYRDDPMQNRYQIWAGENHVSYQDAVTRGIPQDNGDGEKSFVREHLNRLNEIREGYTEYDRSESYGHEEFDRSAGEVKPNEEETIRMREDKADKVNTEHDTESARRAGQSGAELPGNEPDASVTNYVGSHMIR